VLKWKLIVDKFILKNLKEIKRSLIKDQEFTIKVSEEAIHLIDEILKNKALFKRQTRKLLNRLEKLDNCVDIGEMIYYQDYS